MGIRTLANYIATRVKGKTSTHAAYPAVYHGDYVYMDGRNYKCDVAVDIELTDGESCWVVLNDNGNTAVIVGK